MRGGFRFKTEERELDVHVSENWLHDIRESMLEFLFNICDYSLHQYALALTIHFINIL